MNELKIFENPEFGEIRTIEENGKVLFCGSDIAKALGYKNPSKALSDHCKGVTKRYTPTASGKQEMNFIPEGDIYRLAAKSELSGAERFESWIFDEVLPSIRKNGGYIAGQAELSPEELMARALMVAQRTLAERDARISALTVENEVMRPKAGYFDDMVDRKLNTGIRETAKELSVKEKTFVTFLLEGKYLYRDQKKKLQPYAQYVDDLFVLKECFNEKTNWSGTQLLITPKDRETFRLLCQGI